MAASFRQVYLTFGNMDYSLKNKTGLFPENIIWFGDEGGEFQLSGRKIFIVHYDFLAKRAAETGKYDVVFYGHTHTPWEKTVAGIKMLNPGEISGQYGLASLAIFDLDLMTGKLKIID